MRPPGRTRRRGNCPGVVRCGSTRICQCRSVADGFHSEKGSGIHRGRTLVAVVSQPTVWWRSMRPARRPRSRRWPDGCRQIRTTTGSGRPASAQSAMTTFGYAGGPCGQHGVVGILPGPVDVDIDEDHCARRLAGRPSCGRSRHPRSVRWCSRPRSTSAPSWPVALSCGQDRFAGAPLPTDRGFYVDAGDIGLQRSPDSRA